MACNGSAIMTAMKRFRPKLKRLSRWLGPAAMLAVAPKCALCLLAYAGLGAALGLGGPELCGATESMHWTPVLLGSLGAAGFLLAKVIHRPTPVPG